MKTKLEQLSRKAFSKLMEIGQPFAVLFMTGWCGNSMIMESILLQVNKDFGNQLTFYTFDIENAPDIKSDFCVFTTPTFTIINSSKAVVSLNGIIPKQIIKKEIKNFITRKVKKAG